MMKQTPNSVADVDSIVGTENVPSRSEAEMGGGSKKRENPVNTQVSVRPRRVVNKN